MWSTTLYVLEQCIEGLSSPLLLPGCPVAEVFVDCLPLLTSPVIQDSQEPNNFRINKKELRFKAILRLVCVCVSVLYRETQLQDCQELKRAHLLSSVFLLGSSLLDHLSQFSVYCLFCLHSKCPTINIFSSSFRLFLVAPMAPNSIYRLRNLGYLSLGKNQS